MMKRIVIILSLLLVAFGITGAITIFLHGEEAMGTSNSVPWGTLIAGYEYFVGLSTGLLLVGAIGVLFQKKDIIKLHKSLVTLAILTLISGFMLLLVELGNPLHFFYYILSPNFSSPIWWMAPLYGLYFVLLATLFVFMVKNKGKQVRTITTLTAISALVALICIGFLFGFVVARPYWNGPISPLYFVITAFYSGVALTGLVAVILNKDMKLSENFLSIFKKLYISTVGFVAVIYIGKILVGLYGEAPGKYEAVMSLLSGPLRINFWTFEIVGAIVLPLVVLLVVKRTQLWHIATISVISLISLFFMRYDMVFAGQIVQIDVVHATHTELAFNTFTTTWAEWALVLGGVGLFVALFTLRDMFEKALVRTTPVTNSSSKGVRG
ncbi:hypothetical protein EJF36_04635 [Bacillus sp. HMF5848]|uniref:NrfD/PsrC family molybdoenzyme membrane anchor subunit n=1 Tax=Bacillus sp. HMF5848 TaxID=2495421 RepID=UPI000F786D4A|nr:NrfD/PsrC family molybdoenzyme membrane anchor subunit [Bacillus sp. HMF5848]RSK26201.1 hypothetical protein EJF36_04635 [Bacillus sp. HMF5848]